MGTSKWAACARGVRARWLNEVNVIPAVAAVALLGLAWLPSAAAVPAPLMVAQATLQTDGAAVAWTTPGAPVEAFEIQRSHAGSAFVVVATVGADAFAYLDPQGQASDVYMVNAMVGGQATVISNPAPAVPDLFCSPLDFSLPPPWIKWQCLPVLGSSFHPFPTT
jgi:hypothetical protein